jgi:hypothetical protein
MGRQRVAFRGNPVGRQAPRGFSLWFPHPR